MEHSASRKRRAITTLGFAAGLVGVLLGGCAQTPAPSEDLGFNLVTPGKLTVAFVDGNLPNLALAPDGTLEGMDGAWINAFAEAHDLEVVPVPMEFTAQILAVQQGKVDIGTSTYYTEERAHEVYYAYPFYRDTTGIYVRNGEFDGLDALEGHKIGTIRGWTFGPFIEETYGVENTVYFEDIPQAYSALVNGQIDGMVNSSGGTFEEAYLQFADKIEFHAMEAGDMGLPAELIANQSHNYVRCDNPGLADAMDDVMQELHDSGRWAEVQGEYNVPATPDYTAELVKPTQLCD